MSGSHLVRLARLFSEPQRWWGVLTRRLDPQRSDKGGFLSKAHGIIHIGANVGQERHGYARHALNVVWVEPIPEVFAQLESNLKLFPRQTAYQRLITDVDDKEYGFHISSNQGKSSSILALGRHVDMWPHVSFTNSIVLKSVTLDNFVQAEGLDLTKFDALVLDTQGSELLVLKGGKKTLAKMRFVKVEAADFESYVGGATAAEIDEFMAGLGFHVAQRKQFAHRDSIGSYYDTTYRRY
jgi:FkbM family methyltransferase